MRCLGSRRYLLKAADLLAQLKCELVKQTKPSVHRCLVFPGLQEALVAQVSHGPLCVRSEVPESQEAQEAPAVHGLLVPLSSQA